MKKLLIGVLSAFGSATVLADPSGFMIGDGSDAAYGITDDIITACSNLVGLIQEWYTPIVTVAGAIMAFWLLRLAIRKVREYTSTDK